MHQQLSDADATHRAGALVSREDGSTILAWAFNACQSRLDVLWATDWTLTAGAGRYLSAVRNPEADLVGPPSDLVTQNTAAVLACGPCPSYCETVASSLHVALLRLWLHVSTRPTSPSRDPTELGYETKQFELSAVNYGEPSQRQVYVTVHERSLPESQRLTSWFTSRSRPGRRT